MASQVEFSWSACACSTAERTDRTDYTGFNLNGVAFRVGDYVLLYPEGDENTEHYVARILSAFLDKRGLFGDPHCVEVSWFERRAHVEPEGGATSYSSREVVELEETDVNPIGCISGKACVLKAASLEEATRLAESVQSGVEWFFSRGVFRAGEGIVSYPELADHHDAYLEQHCGKRSQPGSSGQVEGVADSEDMDEAKRQRFSDELPSAPMRRTGKLVSGRTCVECGATQTPQWREGPAGPKTLCNACGVRYVRAQQRANKRAVTMGLSRPSCGSGGRQSRAAKGAKAEAASARSAARASAAAAAAADEASQRPLRQAALLAANKTAQYARTGVFPQSAQELQQYGSSGGSQAAGQPELDACVGMESGRPGTPHCSSAYSSDSMQEGVTVEVVIGAADGEIDCCATHVSFPMLAAASAGTYLSQHVMDHQHALATGAGPGPRLPSGDGCGALPSGSCAATGCVPSVSGRLLAECGGGAVVESPAAAAVVSVPVSPSAHDGAGSTDFLMCSVADTYGVPPGCGMAGLDDEYGPLVEVEVDFGLGPAASTIGGAALFDVLHHSAADTDPAGADDLPAVAARAAHFCADLAPGTDARQLLDALPVLAAGSGADSQGAADCGLVPGEAVSHLVSLGRQASRATTEAVAADAAVHAVSQVLEAHQDAARRAREAAASNLGRLKDCINHLAGADAASALAADVSGLIDMRDLAPGSDMLLGGMMGACCFDAALIAVHS